MRRPPRKKTLGLSATTVALRGVRKDVRSVLRVLARRRSGVPLTRGEAVLFACAMAAGLAATEKALAQAETFAARVENGPATRRQRDEAIDARFAEVWSELYRLEDEKQPA